MKRVLNKCYKCGRDIEIEVPVDRIDRYSMAKRFEETDMAECSECNSKSNWKVVK